MTTCHANVVAIQSIIDTESPTGTKKDLFLQVCTSLSRNWPCTCRLGSQRWYIVSLSKWGSVAFPISHGEGPWTVKKLSIRPPPAAAPLSPSPSCGRGSPGCPGQPAVTSGTLTVPPAGSSPTRTPPLNKTITSYCQLLRCSAIRVSLKCESPLFFSP